MTMDIVLCCLGWITILLICELACRAVELANVMSMSDSDVMDIVHVSGQQTRTYVRNMILHISALPFIVIGAAN